MCSRYGSSVLSVERSGVYGGRGPVDWSNYHDRTTAGAPHIVDERLHSAEDLPEHGNLLAKAHKYIWPACIRPNGLYGDGTFFTHKSPADYRHTLADPMINHQQKALSHHKLIDGLSWINWELSHRVDLNDEPHIEQQHT
ncbi:hypothetical protein BKA62DRAFT_675214 [Auriculariales sp. MPI-PUGE-AT-0066]|nr:hypothetical protein BKA62DRAFT_675214 [Auriculariales sp. MPI-PUGE-AT-0066]